MSLEVESKLRGCAARVVETLRGWPVLWFALRVCFSLGSGFWEFSALGKLGRPSGIPAKAKALPVLAACVLSLVSGLWWGCFLGVCFGWMWKSSLGDVQQ